jgi:tRNA-uridine 2-sulfurtransferase
MNMARIKNKKTVFVGLSGGVDSAVSAMLLKKAGYEVVGVFIKTWHPDFLECNEEEERMDAMRVAARLDISFLTFDFEDVYKKEVADYMIREYKAGKTPNPDVMCNKEVKFGAFLKKAIAMGADFVATGHYAKIGNSVDGIGYSKKSQLQPATRNLQSSPDRAKDQSYFLWTLRQEQLKKILFPIGDFKKAKVRILAKKFNLPVAEKKDSQGICFLGAVDLKEFLKHYIKSKRGKVLNEKGDGIGHHDGAVFYTLGERHGFTITKKIPTDGAYYVVGKDIKRNILIVSQKFSSPLKRGRLDGGLDLITPPLSSHYQGEEEIHLQNTNWINEIPKPNKNYAAQIRYHSEFLLCKVMCQRFPLTTRQQKLFLISRFWSLPVSLA